MNLWYIVSDVTPVDEWGDALDEVTQYSFDQFTTRNEAYQYVQHINRKKSKKPIIALVDWSNDFWNIIYKKKQRI